MDAQIDVGSILDCIEFHIFPGLNRYETWALCAGRREKVASGVLEHLVLHSAEANSLYSKGFDSKFILRCPKKLQTIKWFTKSTLIRFLHIIGSPNTLDAIKSLANEISQLEGAWNFHLTLYKKDTRVRLEIDESGNNFSSFAGSSINAEGSDSSKNELLRAMDSRLSALRGEVIAAFDQAAGSRCSVEDMIDVKTFSENIGSEDLSCSLLKYIELRQGTQAVASLINKRSSETEKIGPEETCGPTNESSFSELQVELAASSVKAANVEGQSFTESEKSSFSSEDDERASVERSRRLARSFSPRRSASPMRRVQIGRSGSRRSTAISIKSLNYFPGRDRSFMTQDMTSDSGDEKPQGSIHKCENSVNRMSVQDAIHLFESKRRDQIVDVHKVKSSVNSAIGSYKSVLRRWSSGVVQDTSRSTDGLVEAKDNQVFSQSKKVADVKPETECSPVVLKGNSNEHCCSDTIKLDCPEGTCGSENVQEVLTESNGRSCKLVASSEWNRQKEAELNELFMKMMESKPVKVRTTAPANTKREGLRSEQRCDSYDQYKEKQDKKHLGSAAKKGTVKNKPVKAVQQAREAKNLQVSSTIANDAVKSPNPKKIQRQQKITTEPANPKIASSPAGIVKKGAPSPKASSLPLVRKSWPSMPSPKVTGALSAKDLGVTSSTGAAPTRRKSTLQADYKKISRTTTGKKQQSVLKPGKVAERKSQVTDRSASEGKPSLYSKVTKRSSVVPLESKPYSRKNSGNASVISSAATSKETSSDFQEPFRTSEDLIKSLTSSTELEVTQQEQEPEPNKELNSNAITEPGSAARSTQKLEDWGEDEPVTVNNIDRVAARSSQKLEDLGEVEPVTVDYIGIVAARSPQKLEDLGEVEPVTVDNIGIVAARSPQKLEDLGEVEPDTDDNIGRVAEPELKIETEEECIISPQAWVEIEEAEDHSNTCGDHISDIVDSPTKLASVRESSPRVRHSLSQMLLQETHVHDAAQWGNAENPQPIVYRKDATKGLKRLLKFGLKSKSDANSNSRRSSPSTFAEEEDAAEITKFVNERNTGKLLRKTNLHPKNSRDHKNSDEKTAQIHKSKFSAQSLPEQLLEGNVTSTKARSFFSLSAFKSSK